MEITIEWIPFSKKRPKNSEAVIITDGVSIASAHWFNKLLAPVTHEILPGRWGNWHLISGDWFDEPTHWIEPSKLVFPWLP